MPKLRETRISLLYAYDSSVINDEEFVLLYDITTTKSPDFPYWKYEAIELDVMSDDECQAEFRFYKNDVYNLGSLEYPRRIYMLATSRHTMCIL